MRPSAAEALKAAIRRSLPLAAILVVLGIVVVNAVRQLQGPQYSASSKVFHSTTDIGSILTDIQPSFIDPERVIETALSLAESPEVYERAASKLPGDRTADEVQSATSVSGDQDSDVIGFTTTLDDSDDAVAAVNTVATEYIAWRSEIFAKDIRLAVQRIEDRLAAGDGGSAQADLRAQLNRLRTLEALHSGGAVVVEEATEAPKVSPRPIRDSLLGASFGFVVALLVAGLREAFNTRIRSEADVEDSLRRPVLATIESLPKRAGLVTVGRHESRYGDTYALLAANVMQMRGQAKRPTVLAVTSAIAGEGKTTTAANLAVAMAQRGQRVVLADFDLRKPSVGRMFRIPTGSPGVVQLVDGAAALDSALWTVPLNGAGPQEFHPKPLLGNGYPVAAGENGSGSLRVVASGGNERGARVARSPQLPQLLDELGKNADVVILDTPPALATVEMAELSRTVVDAVLVVVRHGRVTRRSLLSLQRQSEGWQSEILGAVLVDAPPEEDDYYYYKS